MYFPYLRGRQNELLALRELLEADLLSDRVIPIIEPTKKTATYKKTMNYFDEEGRTLYTIINPKVGDYLVNSHNHPIFPVGFDLKYDALLMQESNFGEYFSTLRDSEEFIEIFKEPDELNNFSILNEAELYPQYILISSNRFKRELGTNHDFVSLNDPFEKEARNVDYLIEDDRFFSNDHLYYKKKGNIGYSDYSIIGEEYIDGGFAPRAVAIHIVYFDDDKNLRIKHFVSDSNEDITNPAGKFNEALEKLIKWAEADTIEMNRTETLKEFINLFEQKRYPGLGYVKKLSIKHHMELIGRHFDAESE